MRICRFFIICFVMVLIELFLLDLTAQPTLPLVKLLALVALVAFDVPWYAQVYLLFMVGLSSFFQGFSMAFDVSVFAVFTVMGFLLRDMMIKNRAAQTAVVVILTFAVMAWDCWSCCTLHNVVATILITPVMIKLLQ